LKEALQRERKGKTSFRPRARLIKLIGSELIRDEVMAVVELVKNAHDADASHVRLEMIDVTTEQGEIRIFDDGHGMGVKELLDAWMQPAGSTKAAADRKYSKGGRRVLGEKGVGRFAADRLGQFLELESRSRYHGETIEARFDWDLFDDPELMLSDIQTEWKARALEPKAAAGTVIIIRGLRSRWDQRAFRKMAIRLQRLVNPLSDGSGFTIELTSNEFPDYSGHLDPGIVGMAPYNLSVDYDGNGSLRVSNGEDEEVVLPWVSGRPLCCGPARVILRAFDLESDSISRIGSPVEVRAWLRQWSGVSIYRDGFRVLPYGEPDNDWLRLDQRRVNNPVEHLSNNQVVGFVEITSDGNLELRDQTNRGGLIHGPAYEDLKRLVLYSLQLVERKRQSVRRPKLDENKGNGTSEELDHLVSDDQLKLQFEDLATRAKGGVKKEIRSLGKSIAEQMKSRQSVLEKEIQEYRNLAVVGQSLRDLSLVTRAQIGDLQDVLAEIKRQDLNGSGKLVSKLEGLLDSVRTQQSLVAEIGTRSRRQSRVADLHRELESFQKSLEPLIISLCARIKISKEAGLLDVRVPGNAIQQVLLVLISNTLDWCEPGSSPQMHIQVKDRDEDWTRLLVTDNGPGIPQELKDEVFKPGFSTKEGGAGFGLTLARHVLEKSGASITCVSTKGRAGAGFEIVLPSRKARKFQSQKARTSRAAP
jgi:signal transduction histidine kinase